MSRSNNELKKRAYSFLVPIFFLSLFLACVVISVGNDMFAFFKPEHEAVIEISSPISLREMSRALEDNGIISNPTVFSMYVRSKDAEDDITSFIGRVELRSDMSYRELLLVFASTSNKYRQSE